MDQISLRNTWHIAVPLDAVFRAMTDFERYPHTFPNVAESIRIVERSGDHLRMEATVKSFGSSFPVRMHTTILPGRGFISDNESPKFGVSGHEEFLLSEERGTTRIDYTYQLTIHKRWLRAVAKPLIGKYSMKHWEKAVIDELRKLAG